MDYQPIITASLKKAAARYKAGEITVDEMRAWAERCRLLKENARRLDVLKDDWRWNARIKRGIGRVRDAFKTEGGVVRAMDCYCTDDAPLFHDLSVTTYFNGEVVGTDCYIVEGSEDEAGRFKRAEEHGDAFVVTRGEILKIAQQQYDGADVVLYHSLHLPNEKGLVIDRSKRFFFDLAQGFRTNENGRDGTISLAKLCEKYDVPYTRWSTNVDTQAIMAVALAMIEEI